MKSCLPAPWLPSLVYPPVPQPVSASERRAAHAAVTSTAGLTRGESNHLAQDQDPLTRGSWPREIRNDGRFAAMGYSRDLAGRAELTELLQQALNLRCGGIIRRDLQERFVGRDRRGDITGILRGLGELELNGRVVR